MIRRLARRGLLALAAIGLVLGTGAACQTAMTRRDAARYPAPGQLVDVGGRRMHVQCSGHGSPTVLLEAGGTHDSTHYGRLLRELAPHTRTCAYDRPGMGWSDPSPAPLSAGSLASDLARLLAAATPPIQPPYIIVAGSAGGLTAELFARRHPDEVAALVFLDALNGTMIEPVADHLRSRACLGRVLSRLGVLRVLDPLHRRTLPPRERALAVALTYRNATWDSICSLLGAAPTSAAQIAAAPPLRRDLPLRVLVHGPGARLTNEGTARDAMVEQWWRDGQARFAARSSRGELIVAAGSGHHIVADRPDLVRDAVLRLVASARAAPSLPSGRRRE